MQRKRKRKKKKKKRKKKGKWEEEQITTDVYVEREKHKVSAEWNDLAMAGTLTKKEEAERRKVEDPLYQEREEERTEEDVSEDFVVK